MAQKLYEFLYFIWLGGFLLRQHDADCWLLFDMNELSINCLVLSLVARLRNAMDLVMKETKREKDLPLMTLDY